MTIPTATAIYDINEHAVNITWTSFDTYMPLVNGVNTSIVQFVIYRRAITDDAYIRLDYTLPPTALSFTDDTIVEEGIYTYLIVAVDKFLNTKVVSIVIDTTGRVAGYSFIEQTMRKLPRWTAAWPQLSLYQDNEINSPTSTLATYSLSGSVQDRFTSGAISGAVVTAKAIEYAYTSSTTTNLSGGFLLSLPAPATYDLLISKSGSLSGNTYYSRTIPSIAMTLGNQVLSSIGLSSSATGVSLSIPVSAALQVKSGDAMYQSALYPATTGGVMPTIAVSSVVWEQVTSGVVITAASGTIVSLSSPTTLTLTEYAATGTLMTFKKTAPTLTEDPPTYRISSSTVAAGDNIYTWTSGDWLDTGTHITSVTATSATGAIINGTTLATTGMHGNKMGFQAPSVNLLSGATSAYVSFIDGTYVQANPYVPSFIGEPEPGVSQKVCPLVGVPFDPAVYTAYNCSPNTVVYNPVTSVASAVSVVSGTVYLIGTIGSIYAVLDDYYGEHIYDNIVEPNGTNDLLPYWVWRRWSFPTSAAAINYYNSVTVGTSGTAIYGYDHDNYRLRAFTSKDIVVPLIDTPVSGDVNISPLSNDTLLRRVLTAECMPIGTAYSVAQTMNEGMYLNTSHVEQDSVIWQVSYTPKPAQKIVVSYEGTQLRQAATLWDFVNTTDAVWFITKYADGKFDELSPSKLIYIRNLDVQEVTGLIDTDRYMDICATSDYFDDSSVWIETPAELEDRTPIYFKWRLSNSISTTGTTIRAKVSLPDFIGVATARYRSSALRTLTINTPTIDISGLSVNMRALTFENPIDGLATIAGIKRLPAESNTDLINRITIENYISGMEADRSALYTTANSLGYLSLAWWDTSTSPLLTLEDEVIDVYIPGLPETAFGNDLLIPESSGSTRYILTDKKQIDIPYNINVNSLSFSSGAIAVSGLIDLDRHYSRATISYSYKNFTKTEVGDFITELSVIDGNTTPNLYPVLCLRRINAVISAPLAVARATRTLDLTLGLGAWGQKAWLDESINKLTYLTADLT